MADAWLQATAQKIKGVEHLTQHTGEHEMAARQIHDALDLIPDREDPYAHPADEPVVRLNQMIERAESFFRRYRLTHAVCAGTGATAAAVALVARSRRVPVCWLRPSDRTGLIERFDWEASLERLIRSQSPSMQIIEDATFGALGKLRSTEHPVDLARQIEGFDPTRPYKIIAVQRRLWGGMSGDKTIGHCMRALAAWAEREPGTQWAVLSLLYGRWERPLREWRQAPEGIIMVPPLPYAVYRALLAGAGGILTDSPLIAEDALNASVPVLSLGESEAPRPAAGCGWLPVRGEMLAEEGLWEAAAAPSAIIEQPADSTSAQVMDWLQREGLCAQA